MYYPEVGAKHPDDLYWERVENELDNLDAIDQEAGPSTGRLIDVDVDSTPVPPPRSKHRQAAAPPIPRPRSLRHSPPDGFELIDYSQPTDVISLGGSVGRSSPESNQTALLESPVTGFVFGRDGKYTEIKLERGTLLKPLTKPDSVIAKNLRELGPHSKDLLFTDLMRRNVGVLVRGSHLMRLSDDQTLLLLPATPEERLELHKDFERFHFVENLRIGDPVSVITDNNSAMYQGRVVWMGERPREVGTWYQVETNRPSHSMSVPDWGGPPPPRSLYANAAHIHKPLRNHYDYRSAAPPPVYQPEVRHIPIKRVETRFNADNTTTQTVRVDENPTDADLHNWDGDPRTVTEPLREWKEKPQERQRNGRPRTSSSGTSTATQPSRSQSAHAVVASDKTTSVDDPARTNGVRVGDRCVWHDGTQYHKGTIRFVGYLKGHTNLYAGVEFDNAVGKGTGVFQGETVFTTAENRAGFVVLSSLEILPRPSEMNGQEKQLAVKHKQASAESLSDPAQPPAVPPRPAMKAEDYLIDNFSIGSYVEVCHIGACRSGVVKWIGDAMSEDNDHLERSAVVELDTDIPHGWRPAIQQNNSPPFTRRVLVPTTTLRRDRRVDDEETDIQSYRLNGRGTDFGSIDSGIETTPCEPWKLTEDLIGRMKGIQGHKNSCYLDATLYAMFAQSTTFDFLLERAPRKSDIPQYKELIRLLSTEIVYPLRKFHYVRADHVMKIRELLAEIMPNVKGLTSEEKDPEEILGQLFGNILKAEPFVKLINKENKIDHMYLCPMIVEDWQGGVATTQHLLERHMRAAQVKFVQSPSTLILQLPRYGQQKVFDKILPLERIDITGLVHNAVQPCYECKKPAEGMCPECFLCKRVFLTEVSYCASCYKKVHFNGGEPDHVMRGFYPSGKPVKKASNHKMVLSAVLCIETSHYVAFVRSATGRWLFFDSMADREGLSDGFNVPQVKECENMSFWLSSNGWARLRDADYNGNTKMMLGKGSDVDPLVTRLLSDSYICFYDQEEPSPNSTSSNILNNMFQRIKL